MTKKYVVKNAAEFLQRIVKLDDGKPLDLTNYHVTRIVLSLSTLLDNVVLRTSRQVGKSVTLALEIIKSSLKPYTRSFVLHPKEKQSNTFSKKKFGAIINNSPKLQQLLLSKDSPLKPPTAEQLNVINNVNEKIFANSSIVTFNYAADEVGVERIRGESADRLYIDEAQSIDLQNILPILKPVLESSDDPFLMLTGTPISVDDPLSIMFEKTTQHTMVIKCDKCGKWNTITDPNQITKEGITCTKCNSLLDISKGEFVPMNPDAEFFGLHVNRFMFPKYVHNPRWMYKQYLEFHHSDLPRDKLIQEYLGVPAAKSAELIGREEIEACASPTIKLYNPNDIVSFLKMYPSKHRVFIGIDWGGSYTGVGGQLIKSGNSFTAITVWEIGPGSSDVQMKLIFHKLYTDNNPKSALEELLTIIFHFDNPIVAVDALGGTFAIAEIMHNAKARGRRLKLYPIQLLQTNNLIQKGNTGDRLIAGKNLAINRFLNIIFNKRIVLPKSDLLLKQLIDAYTSNVMMETVSGSILYRKKASRSDDLLMASIFAMLGALVFYEMVKI